MELKGMVALVTGAAQGIGKATAEVFAREGASVVLNDINEEVLNKSAKDIEDACKEGREEFYFDHLAIAATSGFDQDALAYATDHKIACIVFDGKRFRIVNEDKIDWLP